MLSEVGLGAEVLNKYPHEFRAGNGSGLQLPGLWCWNRRFWFLTSQLRHLMLQFRCNLLICCKNSAKNMLGYIFISHDMKAVRAMSDRIAVMKDGKFVEVGSRERIFDNPQEEYTRKLISASV